MAAPSLPATNQVRFHQTDYAGPGKFDERETSHTLESSHDHSHSHSHEDAEYYIRERFRERGGSYSHRAYTVGIGGPVGSGKTALTLALCRALRSRVSMGVVTNDIFTQEDAEFLVRHDALPRSRIAAVETGGCPHAAIREDVSANLAALERLTGRILRDDDASGNATGQPLLLCESGGDNLAANFSSELADYTVYVIDVAGGDKVPRKGGPGITQSDVLVINKIDLAEAVGASLDVMRRDASMMRRRGFGVRGTGVGSGGDDGDCEDSDAGPTIFASIKNGEGLEDIISHIMNGFDEAHRQADCMTEGEKSGL